MITEDVYLGPGEGIEWDEYPVKTECPFCSICFRCKLTDCYFKFKRNQQQQIRVIQGIRGRIELDAHGRLVRRRE